MKTMVAILTLVLIVSFAFGQSAELHKAAYSGDVSKAREILQKGVNPDHRDSFGGTALHAAMFQKNMEIVRLLLESQWVNSPRLAAFVIRAKAGIQKKILDSGSSPE